MLEWYARGCYNIYLFITSTYYLMVILALEAEAAAAAGRPMSKKKYHLSKSDSKLFAELKEQYGDDFKVSP